MKQEIEKQLTMYIEQIIKLWSDIKEKITEVAAIYVTILDQYPDSKEKLIAEIEKSGAYISTWTLNRLEDIGRGRMHPKLMPGMSDIHEAAKLRILPFSDQRDIIDKGKKYPLLLASGDSILVDLMKCSKEQMAQLIDPDGHIRDLSEQKLWLIDNKKFEEEKEAKEIRPPYQITSKGAVIAGHLFTKALLREILIQL